MSLKRFLEASYALMAEEHQRINPLVDLLSVAEKLNPTAAKVEKVPSKGEVSARNEASMKMLEAMTAPLGKKRLKPRRA